jgi:hypothetical protein
VTAESAIVLSVFLLIILSMVEMARLGMAYNLLALAAREGCRAAAIPNSTEDPQTAGESAAQAILNAGGITSYNTPHWTWGSGQSGLSGTNLGDAVTLTLSVPFQNISWLSRPLFLGSVTLQATATHSSENPS